MLQVWIPNTIPLPAVMFGAVSGHESMHIEAQQQAARSVAQPQQVQEAQPQVEQIKQEIDEGDNFTKGAVSKYFPYQGYGFVKDKNGRDIYFSLQELNLVGTKGRDAIRKDMVVGFDVAWTSKGLHVKKMKVY